MLDIGQMSQLVADYGYYALFLITVVEGPIITVIAGFLASLGILGFFWAYIVVIVGDLGGDVIYYFAGRLLKKGAIGKGGKFFGVKLDEIERVECRFRENGGKILLIGKLSHGIGGAFLLAAGFSRMRLAKFLFFNFIGTLPKSLALMVVGYYFGRSLASINSVLESLGAVFLGAGIVGLLSYYFYYRTK